MNKLEFSLRLARESNRSPGEAADDVETLVHRILKDLRRTKSQAPLAKAASSRGPAEKPAKRQDDRRQSRS